MIVAQLLRGIPSVLIDIVGLVRPQTLLVMLYKMWEEGETSANEKM